MPRVRLAVYIGEKEYKVGTGKIALLETIEELGSISAAARAMGMGYRHAWELVDSLNCCFREPVVEVSIGGKSGGGAKLSAWGHDLVARFRKMEQDTLRAIDADLEVLIEALAVDDASPTDDAPSNENPSTKGGLPGRE